MLYHGDNNLEKTLARGLVELRAFSSPPPRCPVAAMDGQEVILRVRRLPWPLKLLIGILLVPIVGCGGLFGLLLALSAVDQIPANVIRAAREQGKLAPLPPSATDLRTDGWSNGFASERHLRFKAKPVEIEQFLAASPGLKGVRPERFQPKHMYLPSSMKTTFDSLEALEESTRHRYFYPHGPTWYAPAIRVKGRRYEIPWHGGQYHGEVIVDDIAHVVFIETSYS
jgi:hypothetical protein